MKKILPSLLCTETTLVFFHISGNIPFFIDSSHIIFTGILTASLQIFIILIDRLSYPRDLLASKDFPVDNIDNISFFASQKKLILALVFYKREVIHYCFLQMCK